MATFETSLIVQRWWEWCWSCWAAMGSRLRSSRSGVALKHGVCAYRGHSWRWYVERDRVSLFCPLCGLESPGLDLHTVPIRQAWMRERQRIRWEAHRHRWTWLQSSTASPTQNRSVGR